MRVAEGRNEPSGGVLRDDLRGRAAAQDAVRQTPQPLGIHWLVGTAAVADDLDARAAVLAIPYLLGELQMAEERAVGAFRAGLAPGHVCTDTRTCTF